MILYHGTDVQFDRFYDGSFFTDSYAIAQEYGTLRYDHGGMRQPRILLCEVDVGTMIEVSKEDLRTAFDNHPECHQHKPKSYPWWDKLSWDVFDYEMREWLRTSNIDTFKVTGLSDLGGCNQTQYIVKSASQIVMLEEALYDSEGRRW